MTRIERSGVSVLGQRRCRDEKKKTRAKNAKSAKGRCRDRRSSAHWVTASGSAPAALQSLYLASFAFLARASLAQNAPRASRPEEALEDGAGPLGVPPVVAREDLGGAL